MKITEVIAELQKHLTSYGDDETLVGNKSIREIQILEVPQEEGDPKRYASIITQPEE